MLLIEEINEIDALASLRPAWDQLLAATPAATFFQSLDWLEVFWRHYGHRGRLRALVAHDDDGPIGILPLWVHRPRTRLGRLRTLTYPLLDWGTFHGPIGPNPTATLLAALGHLKRSRRDWDVLELHWTRASQDRDRTPRAMAASGLAPVAAPERRVAMIDLTGSWASYWAGRASRWRNNVRRSEKILGRLGAIDYFRHRPGSQAAGDGDPRSELFDKCLEIAAQSWQGDSASGNTLSHGEVAPFLRDAHLAAARAARST